jgi:sec-independent protein translocase protein TatA
MNVMFALFDLGGGQIVLILLLVLIFFGARKLPELAKGLGQGIKEFKKATREVTDEIQQSMDDVDHSAPPPKNVESTQKKLSEPIDTEKDSTVPQSAEHKS